MRVSTVSDWSRVIRLFAKFGILNCVFFLSLQSRATILLFGTIRDVCTFVTCVHSTEYVILFKKQMMKVRSICFDFRYSFAAFCFFLIMI